MLPSQESPSSTRIFRLMCYSPGPHWPAWLHLPAGKDAFPALLWLARLLLGAASPWPAFDSPSGNRMSNTSSCRFAAEPHLDLRQHSKIHLMKNALLSSWWTDTQRCNAEAACTLQRWTPLTGNTGYFRLLGEHLHPSAVYPKSLRSPIQFHKHDLHPPVLHTH